ncbi:MAG: hypothetical protein QY328_09840 [Anaerolineales bacterium]|nr:hypothetical protein [Anaerolineales bacterium]WKZ38554.1 MAG: hypothetical protein QY328_09840 [Anaerolineales bacterium]
MSETRVKPKAFATLCGRIFRDTDPQYFPSAEHRGKRILLCTDACLGAFLADPDVFCKVHRNSDKAATRLKTEIQHLIGLWSKYDTSTKSD